MSTLTLYAALPVATVDECSSEAADAADLRRHEGALARLTVKERDVLALMAEGDSNERIAWRLQVTSRTVESHISRIFAKLGLAADPATHRRVLAVLAHFRAGAAQG